MQGAAVNEGGAQTGGQATACRQRRGRLPSHLHPSRTCLVQMRGKVSGGAGQACTLCCMRSSMAACTLCCMRSCMRCSMRIGQHTHVPPITTQWRALGSSSAGLRCVRRCPCLPPGRVSVDKNALQQPIVTPQPSLHLLPGVFLGAPAPAAAAAAAARRAGDAFSDASCLRPLSWQCVLPFRALLLLLLLLLHCVLSLSMLVSLTRTALQPHDWPQHLGICFRPGARDQRHERHETRETRDTRETMEREELMS
jgi:hypothetical protein